jgi:protein TonB
LGAPGLSALIGSGHGAGAGRAAEVVAIREDIRKSLQGSVVYPPMARRFGMEGTVVASFELQSDGTPTAIAVRESSGYEILDTTVIALIRRVSPFPAPGVRVPDVRIPVTFRLIPD